MSGRVLLVEYKRLSARLPHSRMPCTQVASSRWQVLVRGTLNDGRWKIPCVAYV